MQHSKSNLNFQAEPEDLDILLDNLLQGIICINSLGIVTTYNLAAQKILKIESNLILNNPFFNFFDDNIFGFSIQKTLKDKKISSFKFNYPYKSLNLEVQCRLIKDGLIIIIQDLTEMLKAENLAHASNRLKDLGGMTAMLAHEIRNPLGGIKGFASLLRRDLEKEPNLRQMVDFIIEGTDNLNRLVSHILNFAHPLDIQFSPFDLVELASNLKKTIEVDPKFNNQIIFNIRSSASVIMLPIDVELFRSMLLNLMINSIQAMPNGGTLTVSLEENEDEVTIKVIDTGVGIKKENLKKIFSAFFTTKTDGNGFGLLEVYKVVQAHKGIIEVESTEGKGTTFTIKIKKKKGG